MGRRIWLNIIRRPFWIIQRVLLFVVLFSFFAMAFFMEDIVSCVNQETLSGVDLNVAIGSYMQQGSYQARFSGSFQEYCDAINDYVDVYNQLDTHAGVEYAGMDIETGPLGVFFVKEKGRMGISFVVKSPVNRVQNVISFTKEYGQFPTNTVMRIDYYNRFEQQNDNAAQIENIPIEEQSDFQVFEHNNYVSFIYGTSAPVPQRMHLGTEILTAGRSFTPEEIEYGDMVCYIPEDLVWFDRSLGDDGYKIYELGDDITVSACLFGQDGYLSDSLDYTFRVIGKYKATTTGPYSAPSNQVYIPRQTLVRMHNEAYEYYVSNGKHYFELVNPVHICSPTAMTFTLDSMDALNDFIEAIESLPQYRSGELMYYASVSDVAEVYAGLMSIAEGFSSILYVFAVLVVIIAAMIAVLDAFYRRREIALLQSLGESASSVTLQFVLENLSIMAVSNVVAVPLALAFSRSAVLRFISNIPAGKNAGRLPGVEYVEALEIDTAAIIDSISVSAQQILLSIMLIVVALAACAAVVFLFAKRFNSRRLLNVQ